MATRAALHTDATQVAAHPRWYVVDIRPKAERDGALGYIPGSRSVPTEAILADRARFEARFEPDATVVLVCTSGRRSAVLAEQLAPALAPTVATLEGGTLAWAALGLPTCGVRAPESALEIASLDRVPRALLACFAAEAVENTLDGRVHDAMDAQFIVRAALERECADALSPGCLEAALERIAETARRSGFKLERIQENIDAFRAAIARLHA